MSKNIRGPKRNPRTTSVKLPPTQGGRRKGDQYTIPKVKYTYRPVEWEVFLANIYDGYKTVRSSFIPYVVIGEERYWLLGSFHDFPRDILMDFGGSCIIWDPPKKIARRRSIQQKAYFQHQFGCAMLELNEESKGLLVQPVLRSLGTVKPDVYRGTNTNRKEYVWFVMVQLNYKEIANIEAEFEGAPLVLKGEKLGPLGFYKESDILRPDGPYRTTRNLTDLVNYLRRT